jgi:hypothetical protein
VPCCAVSTWSRKQDPMRAWPGVVLAGTVLISHALGAAFDHALAASASSVEQHSQGACSPPIANNSGQVTINCTGIDPEALRYLETQLTELFRKLSEQSDANRTVRNVNDLNEILRQQATDWENRYRDLRTVRVEPACREPSSIRRRRCEISMWRWRGTHSLGLGGVLSGACRGSGPRLSGSRIIRVCSRLGHIPAGASLRPRGIASSTGYARIPG